MEWFYLEFENGVFHTNPQRKRGMRRKAPALALRVSVGQKQNNAGYSMIAK